MTGVAPRRYLLIATVRDRLNLMPIVLGSARQHLPGWRVLVVTQGYGREDGPRLNAWHPDAYAVHLPDRVGPHNAKVCGLEVIHNMSGAAPYVVCSADDDMEFTARTDLDPCVRKAAEPAVGLVSAGWVRAAGQVPGKPAPPEFVRQPIVYTGGGLVFGAGVAALIRAIPRGAYFCDNSEWSLRAYVAGYENYRYRGSVTVHRICGAGGRRAWVQGSPKAMPDPGLLPLKPGKRDGTMNNFHVGDSADLTPLARRMHLDNHAKILAGTT